MSIQNGNVLIVDILNLSKNNPLTARWEGRMIKELILTIILGLLVGVNMYFYTGDMNISVVVVMFYFTLREIKHNTKKNNPEPG